MKLPVAIVDKPWGRSDLPPPFAAAGRTVGEIWFPDPRGDAPLLAKFLFTSERLSIQVHPDDVQARAAGHPRGKSECWYVLEAGPDATIGVGFRSDMTPDAVRAAAIDGSIEDLLDWRPVRAGDFIDNPAGTVHALGAGLTVLEVQQNLDLTYRLYDYGRPRPLHLDEGLSVARLAAGSAGVHRNISPAGTETLCKGPAFHLVRADGPRPWGAAGEVLVLPVDGEVSVDGEIVSPGEAGVAADECGVVVPAGVRALIAWVPAIEGAA